MLATLGIYGTPAKIIAVIILVLAKIWPILLLGLITYIAIRLALKHSKKKDEE